MSSPRPTWRPAAAWRAFALLLGGLLLGTASASYPAVLYRPDVPVPARGNRWASPNAWQGGRLPWTNEMPALPSANSSTGGAYEVIVAAEQRLPRLHIGVNAGIRFAAVAGAGFRVAAPTFVDNSWRQPLSGKWNSGGAWQDGSPPCETQAALLPAPPQGGKSYEVIIEGDAAVTAKLVRFPPSSAGSGVRRGLRFPRTSNIRKRTWPLDHIRSSALSVARCGCWRFCLARCCDAMMLCDAVML